MSVLTRYLNRMFLVRLGIVLFGIMGFAVVVDLLDVAEELARDPSGPFQAGLRYVGLRLPIMLSELLPIAAMIAEGRVRAVFFFVDPLSAHPHDPDIRTVMRVCNVHDVPLAMNVASADLFLASPLLIGADGQP